MGLSGHMGRGGAWGGAQGGARNNARDGARNDARESGTGRSGVQRGRGQRVRRWNGIAYRALFLLLAQAILLPKTWVTTGTVRAGGLPGGNGQVGSPPGNSPLDHRILPPSSSSPAGTTATGYSGLTPVPSGERPVRGTGGGTDIPTAGAVTESTAFWDMPPAEGKALEPLPELRRAAELSALEEPGTPPFHLVGSLNATSDTGRRVTGTLEEDWYNDRWSRQTITLDGAKRRRWVLDGRHVQQSEDNWGNFAAERLLRALFSPLNGIVLTKQAPGSAEVQAGTIHLRCTLLAGQPALVNGLRPESRSLCVDAVSGDLRTVTEGYGFRTVRNGIRVLNRRRIATDITLTQAERAVGHLRLSELRIAPELSPASFAADAALVGQMAPSAPEQRWLMTPTQTRSSLVTLNAHMLPVDAAGLAKAHSYAVVRVLAGKDGHLLDAEILWNTDEAARQHAIGALRGTLFRRREWNGKPILLEGLLTMQQT